jgi:hypothetical protein
MVLWHFFASLRLCVFALKIFLSGFLPNSATQPSGLKIGTEEERFNAKTPWRRDAKDSFSYGIASSRRNGRRPRYGVSDAGAVFAKSSGKSKRTGTRRMIRLFPVLDFFREPKSVDFRLTSDGALLTQTGAPILIANSLVIEVISNNRNLADRCVERLSPSGNRK